jgi:acetoin utilization deacetylase AcuC-like enzyme
MTGQARNAFCAVRPPGHHATPARGMGFCIFNNIAIAARYAQRRHGVERVLIADWDVHHGNGTQDIFWDDPTVLYLSVHQFPYYPGTGAPTEIGGPHAKGASVNVGLPSGSGDTEYLAAFDHVIVPALVKFKPDLVFVSAGFDAYEHDPLAGMRVTFAGFAAMARRLRRVADAVCSGRIIAVLEGGYDLDGLAGGMTQVLATFAAKKLEDQPDSIAPLPVAGSARAAIDATLAAHAAAGVPIPSPEP